MCESMTDVFITHFLRYVVGIGVVECAKYSYNIHIEVRGCLFNQKYSNSPRTLKSYLGNIDFLSVHSLDLFHVFSLIPG